MTTLGVDTIPDGDIISVEEDKGREVKRKRGEGKRGEEKNAKASPMLPR